MTRLAFLLQKSGEYKLDQETFMKVLCYGNPTDLPTKLDVVRYSRQLYLIYAALEMRLLEFPDNPLLAIFRTYPFTNRSDILNDDIQEMESYLTPQESQKLRKTVKADSTTLSFIKKQIETADAVTLFGFLAMRCMGDCHGGQNISQHGAQTFSDKLEKNKFYQVVARAIKDLHPALNDALLNESEELAFQQAVDGIFKYHVALLRELEQSRAATCVSICAQSYPYLRSHAAFFIAAGVTTAIAATVGAMHQIST